MANLIAYSDKFYNVLSNQNCQNIFPSVDYKSISKNSIEYDPLYQLQKGEWFFIDLNSINQQRQPNNKIQNPIDRLPLQTSLPTIRPNNYKEIAYFILDDNQNNWFLFQKIYSKSRVFMKKFITFSQQPKLQEDPLIILKNVPDALFNNKDFTLYFQDLDTITNIFLNIISLFREATDQEIKDFFQNEYKDIIERDSNFRKISIVNRKQIALCKTKFSNHNVQNKRQFLNYMGQFNLDLTPQQNGKFLIKDNKQLTTFLDIILEKYYETVVTKEKRIAQSTRTI